MEGLEIHRQFPVFKKVISILRNIDFMNAIENYNIKELVEDTK